MCGKDARPARPGIWTLSFVVILVTAHGIDIRRMAWIDSSTGASTVLQTLFELGL